MRFPRGVGDAVARGMNSWMKVLKTIEKLVCARRWVCACLSVVRSLCLTRVQGAFLNRCCGGHMLFMQICLPFIFYDKTSFWSASVAALSLLCVSLFQWTSATMAISEPLLCHSLMTDRCRILHGFSEGYTQSLVSCGETSHVWPLHTTLTSTPFANYISNDNSLSPLKPTRMAVHCSYIKPSVSCQREMRVWMRLEQSLTKRTENRLTLMCQIGLISPSFF